MQNKNESLKIKFNSKIKLKVKNVAKEPYLMDILKLYNKLRICIS